MKIIFCAIGSRGDVQPMIALAIMAKAKGHDAILCAPPNYKKWVEENGIKFKPIGVDYKEYAAEHPDNISGNPWVVYKGVKQFFARHLSQQFNELAEAANGSDVLVFAGMAFAAPSVAELLKIPAISIVYSTCMIPSRIHPPALMPLQTLPTWLNKLCWWGNEVAANTVLNSALNLSRQAHGMSPTKFSRQFYNETPFIVAADAELLPMDPAWGGRHSFANFILFSDKTSLAPDLEEWLDQGEPPIYIGFGSMQGHGIDRVARILIDALTELNMRCLIASGWSNLDNFNLPDNWKIIKDAPHEKLFPRVRVIVHHGGSGTMARALKAGVSQVIVPLLLDQFYHAHKLHKAGLIPQPVPMEKITAAQIVTAIKTALELPPEERLKVAHRLNSSNGASHVIDIIKKKVDSHGYSSQEENCFLLPTE